MDALTLTRRRLLQSTAAAGACAAAGVSASFAPSAPAPARPPEIADYLETVKKLREQVRALAGGWVESNHVVRPDGFVYAVDVTQLLACTVDAGDGAGYLRL